MLTLREFLKIAKGEQYRIYQPNRDCLIFESYLKVHSPYKFGIRSYKYQNAYWENNDYCRGVYENSFKDPAYDKETKAFLDSFGDMEVFCVETSTFKPMRMYHKAGQLCIEDVVDPFMPEERYLSCLNIFITPQACDCDDCYKSLRVSNKAVPKQEDNDCERCDYYKHLKREKENNNGK